MQSTIDEAQTAFRKEAVTELMQQHSLTLTAFAERIKVSRQAVASYLSGRVSPQLTTTVRMAERFGKPLSYFINGGAEADRQSG